MNVETNDQGQTLVYLTEEEWADYGRQAGYMPEIIKEASTEETSVDNTSSTEDVNEKLSSLAKQVADLTKQLAGQEETSKVKESSSTNEVSGINPINSPLLIKEDSAFNEENYPNLVAAQDQEGLIGPFAPRK
mgnify:CR=1 FL=1|jgi:hypothetical protein